MVGPGFWGGDDVSRVWSARRQRGSAQWRELKLEQVPVVLLQVANPAAALCECVRRSETALGQQHVSVVLDKIIARL